MSKPNLLSKVSEEEKIVPLDKAKVGDLVSDLVFSKGINPRLYSEDPLILVEDLANTIIVYQVDKTTLSVITQQNLFNNPFTTPNPQYVKYRTFLKHYEHKQQTPTQTQTQRGIQ